MDEPVPQVDPELVEKLGGYVPGEAADAARTATTTEGMAAIRAAVAHVYRAGALRGSCSLGLDPTRPSPNWWARCRCQPGRAMLDVMVETRATAESALADLADVVADQFRKARSNGR